MKKSSIFSLLVLLVFTSGITNASDKEALEKMGGKVQMQGDTMVGLRIDCKDWTEAEFRLVGKQTTLTSLSLNGTTLNDEMLKLLTGLKNIKSFQMNQSQISDEGFKHFQLFPQLKSMAIYHHGRELEGFDGSGLRHLKSVTQITFAGAKTGDIAMKAVGELTQLESYSQWHNLETSAGMQHLLKLKNLKSLRIGQRLHDWKPVAKPPSFDDKTFEIISQLKALESITIIEGRLSYDGLSQLKKLPNLKRVIIRMTAVSEADVEQLKKELPSVEVKWEPLSKDEEKKMLTDKLKI